MTPIILIPFVKDLMLGSKFKALEGDGFQLRWPNWNDPSEGIDPEKTVIVVDCNLSSPDPKMLISACREAYPDIPIIGFVSHVDVASQQAALAAGATVVCPRSKFFSRQMPDLLRTYVKES